MSSEKYRFAWTSIFLSATGVAVVVSLNVLQKHHLIDKQTEGLLRLLVNGTLGLILIRNSFRQPMAATLRIAICFTIFSALGETVLDYTEDVPQWDKLPIIGHDSYSRRTIESVLAAGWMLGGFSVFALSMRYLRQSDVDAEKHFAELHQSAVELERTNHQLQRAMEDLSRTRDLVVRRERMNALGEMASSVAHNLNNALTPAAVFSEILLDEASQDPVGSRTREDLESILRSIDDAKEIIGRLQMFYHGKVRDDVSSPLSLANPIRQVVAMTRPKWKDEPAKCGKRIEIEMHLDETRPVLIDPAEFRVVLTNLIFNAVEAMESSGVITIRLAQRADEIELSIADTGCGMSEVTTSRCFEPFFTTKSTGAGLGLSACYGIINRAGGKLVVSSPENSVGSVFTIRLPTVRTAPTITDLDLELSDLSTRRRSPCRLLLVDDEVAVCSATAAMLRNLGAEVVVETSGSSAIFRYLRDSSFDILLTDLGMADVDGRTVVDVARTQNPHQRIAVLSGWPESEVLQRFDGVAPPDVILSKPPAKESLRSMLVGASHSS